MDELTVIGTENGALIVVAADGARFRVPITEALHTALRQNRPATTGTHRVSPREIQAMIREGRTALEVATQTGETLEYIQRFEGPVVAEREYVISTARSVPVAVAADVDPINAETFGTVIDRRLQALNARDVRWESRKTDRVWEISATFVDGETERVARWSFDPKRSVLAPVNHEAQSLSQQSESAAPVLPRLRAVPQESEQGVRFDSGAFAPLAPPPPAGHENENSDTSNTADLLEALRRRRGEREPAAQDEWDSSKAAHPSTGSIRIVDVPLPTEMDYERGSETSGDSLPGGLDADTREITPAGSNRIADDDSPASPPASPEAPRPSGRRGRATMPSWDEIVFGARPDDDPA